MSATPIRLPDTPDYQRANAAQLEAAGPRHSAWVTANAGSGKTKVLIDRVARLLLRGAEPDHILCVTYTKAAANEMLSRLFERLGRWSVMPDGELERTLQRLEGTGSRSYSDEDISRARSLFAHALETPGGLRIETLHAFCARVLKRFPLEAGVPPGFTEIDEAETARLWTLAVDRTLEAAKRDAELAGAVDTVIAAGAGFGLSKAEQLVRAHKAALSRFAETCGGAFGAMRQVLQVATEASELDRDALLQHAMVHALPLEAYRRVAGGLAAGTGKSDAALAETLRAIVNTTDAEARWELAQSVILTKDGKVRQGNPFTKSGDGATGGEASELFQMKDGMGREVERLLELSADIVKRETFERSVALVRFGLPVITHYEAQKRARSALDFDDLISAVGRMLSVPGMSDWVRYKLDGKLSHVLLDEAQDTSPGQWALLNALTAEFFAGEGADRSDAPRTQFVVGDEKQSIYSFQGADPEAFMDERRQFVGRVMAADADVVEPDMNMSFRSTEAVLAFVDAVLENQPLAAGDPGDADAPQAANVSRHVARRIGLGGLVELRPLEPPPEEEEKVAWTAPVDAVSAQSPPRRIAEWIAARCETMIRTGEPVWQETGEGFVTRPTRPGDILILVQTRQGGLFESLIGAIKARGLPVAGADRLILTDHVGVQDLLNLIRFVLFPEDDLALAEILRGPFLNLLDDEAVLQPLRFAKGRLIDAVRASSDPLLSDAKAFVAALITGRDLPPHDFLTSALGHRFADGFTAAERLHERLGEPARDPVEEFLTAALAADARSPASLQHFLHEQELARTEIKRDLAKAGDEIRIMTVHGAKGLEAPVVILADTTGKPKSNTPDVLVTPGAAPVWSSTAKTDPTDEVARVRAEHERKSLAEHYRLLYVALTRAKDRLILCGAFKGRREGEGYAEGSWYGTCLKAFEVLGAVEVADPVVPDAPSLLRFGEVPSVAVAGDHSQMEPERGHRPDWLDRPAPDLAGVDTVSPSRHAVERGAAPSPFGPKREDRFQRGKLIHALFEYLPDLAADRRRASARAFLARVPSLSEAQRGEIARAVFGVLDDPQFADVFAPGGRSEAQVVGLLPGAKGPQRVSGRVDRLVVSERSVLIVDFKTDRPAPADETGVDPAYLFQMASYAHVLGAAFPGHEVRCALVWTDGPRLMPLSAGRLAEALTLARGGLQAGDSDPI